MNWLDFFLIGIIVVGAVVGLRTGLLGAAILAVGAYLGWLVASQLSGAIGDIIGSGISETIVTVASYAVIVVLGIVVARLVFKAVKPFLTAATMGLSSLVDRVGGLILGLVLRPGAVRGRHSRAGQAYIRLRTRGTAQGRELQAGAGGRARRLAGRARLHQGCGRRSGQHPGVGPLGLPARP